MNNISRVFTSFLFLALLTLASNSFCSDNVKLDMGHRIFEGKLKKNSFLKSLLGKYKFSLNDKLRCIAFIDTKNLNINDEVLTKMENKNVAVRGIASYTNEEPYLLIEAYDIYIKEP